MERKEHGTEPGTDIALYPFATYLFADGRDYSPKVIVVGMNLEGKSLYRHI